MLFEIWLGHPLIQADNTWGLLGVMCVLLSFGGGQIYAETLLKARK